jgi:RNA polymerase sigma-70 factor, ECF subfamily
MGREIMMADGACLELAGKVPVESAPPAGADEHGLIRRAQAGDRAAFGALVRAYDRRVLHLILRMVSSSEMGRDLYQEAFLKVFRSLPRFRFESSFSTWLYRVVVNVCLDHLRKQGARGEVQPPPGPRDGTEYFQTLPDGRAGTDPERSLQSREIGRRLQTALRELNPRERVVFELRHYEGLKLRAIGEICGTSEETAKNCLFRATQKLRVALSDLV